MLKRLILFALPFAMLHAASSHFPDPTTDIPATKTKEKVVFAGGCFWGVEAVFESMKGVSNAVSGFAGGNKGTANYETVSTGRTGHAESVEVTYDPNQVSFGQLLKVFFSVVHDPTQLNRQDPDEGTQYRSVVFYANDEQKRIAQDYIDQLDKAKLFPQKIVTLVVPFKAFYPAEAYHQNFAARHPDNPYIARFDLPKVEALQQVLPQLYKAQ